MWTRSEHSGDILYCLVTFSKKILRCLSSIKISTIFTFDLLVSSVQNGILNDWKEEINAKPLPKIGEFSNKYKTQAHTHKNMYKQKGLINETRNLVENLGCKILRDL